MVVVVWVLGLSMMREEATGRQSFEIFLKMFIMRTTYDLATSTINHFGSFDTVPNNLADSARYLSLSS